MRIGGDEKLGGKSTHSIHVAPVQKHGSLYLTSLNCAVAMKEHYLVHQALAMCADYVLDRGHTVRMDCQCHRLLEAQPRKATLCEGSEVSDYDRKNLFGRLVYDWMGGNSCFDWNLGRDMQEWDRSHRGH